MASLPMLPDLAASLGAHDPRPAPGSSALGCPSSQLLPSRSGTYGLPAVPALAMAAALYAVPALLPVRLCKAGALPALELGRMLALALLAAGCCHGGMCQLLMLGPMHALLPYRPSDAPQRCPPSPAALSSGGQGMHSELDRAALPLGVQPGASCVNELFAASHVVMSGVMAGLLAVCAARDAASRHAFLRSTVR